MPRRLLILMLPVAFVACAVPGHVIRTGMDSINPTLAADFGPLPTLADAPAGGRPGTGQGGKTSRTPSRPVAAHPPSAGAGQGQNAVRSPEFPKGAIDRLPEGMIRVEPVNAFRDSASVSMVPASGDQRSRLVRSAKRLVGIRKSFDTRSFLGHLLAICDMLPGGGTSVEWTAVDQMNLARDAGMFREATGRPLPGDIAYFRCGSGCGADSRDGVGTGIVVDAEGGVHIIAYTDGVVGQIELSGRLEPIGYSAP